MRSALRRPPAFHRSRYHPVLLTANLDVGELFGRARRRFFDNCRCHRPEALGSQGAYDGASAVAKATRQPADCLANELGAAVDPDDLLGEVRRQRDVAQLPHSQGGRQGVKPRQQEMEAGEARDEDPCLLYTSDAADE